MRSSERARSEDDEGSESLRVCDPGRRVYGGRWRGWSDLEGVER
jgi:hypothetical protein